MRMPTVIDAEVHVLPPDWCVSGYEPPATETVLRNKIYEHPERERALAGAHEDGLLAEMTAARVDGALLIGLPWRDPSRNRANNAYVARLCRRYPDRFLGLGLTSSPASADVVDEVRSIDEEYGLRGVKVIPSWQEYQLDDAGFEPALTEMEKRGLILFPHVDHLYLPDEGFDAPHRLLTVAARHPGLKIIAPHLGGLLCLYAHHAPVAALISNMLFVASVPLTLPMVRYALDAVGASRVAFGTDFPFNPSHDQRAVRAGVEALGLSEHDRQTVMGRAIRDFLNWPGDGPAGS